MAFQHNVALTLLSTGSQLTIWDGYRVVVDMFSVGNPWSFTLWHTREAEDPGTRTNRRTAWQIAYDEVRCGDFVSFRIDNAVQMIGVIEERKPGHSRGRGAQFVISGRDNASLATDWPGDPEISIRTQTLNNALELLLSQVGIPVVFGFSTTTERAIRMGIQPGAHGASSTANVRNQSLDHFHPQPGERMWELIEKILRRFGYLAWIAPSADGETMNVVVDVPAYGTTPIFVFKKRFTDASQLIVTPDSNVLEGELATNIRGVPTSVRTFGRQPQGDADDGRLATGSTSTGLLNTFLWPQFGHGFPNEITANVPPRIHRVHGRRHRSQNHVDQESARVTSDANRDARLYRCTVQGHGQLPVGVQATGQSGSYRGSSFTAQRQQMTLYTPNAMAHVRDEICGTQAGPLDEDMLVHRVEFTGSRENRDGQRTHLTLGTKGAVNLTPASS